MKSVWYNERYKTIALGLPIPKSINAPYAGMIQILRPNYCTFIAPEYMKHYGWVYIGEFE